MRRHLDTLRRHPGCAGFLLALAAFLVADAIRRHALEPTVLYLGAVGVSVLVVDVTMAWRSRTVRPLPVLAPGVETSVAAGLAILSFICLWTLFVGHYRSPSPLWVLFLVLGLGSVFGLTLALFFLVRGYHPPDLGVRIGGLRVVLPVAAILGISAFLWGRASITNVFASRDTFIRLLPAGLSAGFSEEFLRLAWQSRLGAWRANRAVGWIVASSVWALLHGPRLWSTNGPLHGTLGIVEMMPLGLLFGYITHHTASFLPAALLHSTNVWGLQDL